MHVSSLVLHANLNMTYNMATLNVKFCFVSFNIILVQGFFQLPLISHKDTNLTTKLLVQFFFLFCSLIHLLLCFVIVTLFYFLSNLLSLCNNKILLLLAPIFSIVLCALQQCHFSPSCFNLLMLYVFYDIDAFYIFVPIFFHFACFAIVALFAFLIFFFFCKMILQISRSQLINSDNV